MSQRNRQETVEPTSLRERRAHARGERSRIHAQLRSVVQADPENIDEPGVAYRLERRRGAPETSVHRFRHWKQKAWKRRSADRLARAVAVRGD